MYSFFHLEHDSLWNKNKAQAIFSYNPCRICITISKIGDWVFIDGRQFWRIICNPDQCVFDNLSSKIYTFVFG